MYSTSIVNNRIEGTRITIYDIYYYLEKGRHHTYIAAMLGLSSAQVLAAAKYIDEHREEVEAVHQKIEERNARGNPPEIEAQLAPSRAKLQALLEKHQRHQAEGRNGDRHPGGH